MKLELGIEPEKLKHYNKKNELTILAVSIAFSFTLLFFPSIEMYLGNPHDFTVPATQIFIPLILTSIVGVAAMMLLFNLFLYLSEKLTHFLLNVMLGANLAGYCQILFMNGKMTAFTGDFPDYASPSPENTRNLIIWLCIAAVPALLFIITHLIPGKKAGEAYCRKAVPFAAMIVTGMQLAGFAGNAAKYGIPDYKEEPEVTYFSYDQAMNLNKDKNVLVFITDRLDGRWMNECLEDYPEIYDMMEGFTYYSNNVSNYTNTFPSAPYMLTKHDYNAEDWDTFFDDAWAEDNIPLTLRQNGYTTYLVPDTATTVGDIKRVEDLCDNTKTTVNELDYYYFGDDGIIPTMTDFSLSRLMPYSIKVDFIVSHTATFSTLFSHFPDYMTDRMEVQVSSNTDIRFYNYLKEHGLTTNADKPVFSFIHLNFAHDVEDSVSALYSGFSGMSDQYTSIRGSFEILNEYFRQMKELGIYDNSTIIVIGDHGEVPFVIEVGSDKIEKPITTSLMIKNPGAAHEPLKVDNDAELSNSYLPDSILDYAGISVKGDTFRSLLEKGEYPPRYMDVYHWRSFGNVWKVVSYEITGDANDFSNWKAY